VAELILSSRRNSRTLQLRNLSRPQQSPLEISGPSPWEIYLSESQERMLMHCTSREPRESYGSFRERRRSCDCYWPAYPQNRRLKLSHNGELVSDIDMELLLQPHVKAPKSPPLETVKLTEPEFPEPADLTETLLQLLAAPNIASKEAVIRTYETTKLRATPYSNHCKATTPAPTMQLFSNQCDDLLKGLVISCGMNRIMAKSTHTGWHLSNR